MTDTINHYLCNSTTPPKPEYWKYRDSAAWLFRVWPDNVESSKNGDGWCNRGTRPEWFTSTANTSCIRCDEHGNPLPAMPADGCKPHDCDSASVAPMYWRCNWVTNSQQNGFADYRCLDGVTVEINDGLSWCKTHLSTVSFLETSRDHARCNADGTPLADHIPDAGTMVEPKPDAPLKVGDWVELVIYDDRLYARGWPRKIAHANNLYVGFDFDSRPEWCRGHFRRVPPPRSQCAESNDRIAELERQLAEQAPLVAIARELREWLQNDGGPSSTRNGTFFYDSDDRYYKLLLKLRDAKGGV